MDEKTNSKIEELKRNPPNRFLPVLVLFLVVAAVFLYRVAVTDPEWNASAPAADAPPASAGARAAAQTAKSRPARNPADSGAEASVPAAPAAAADGGGDGEKPTPRRTAGASAAAAEEDADGYLRSHIDQTVPFLYKGEVRKVTLTAFTRSTVTVRRGRKSLTLNRAELSPEQLALWK